MTVTSADLVRGLAARLPLNLARDLVTDFVQLRQDVVAGTLGRAAAGKLVETFVQVLQHLDSGKYDKKPNVDAYLKNIESVPSTLEDGLRICGSRIARGMYALRNKRNIAHKGEIDPNAYDQRYLLHGAQWIVAELLRTSTGLTMASAGKLVDQVQAPAGAIVQDFGTHKLVIADLTTPDEVLVRLMSDHPKAVSREQIYASLDRRKPDTVRKALETLWATKQAERLKDSYRLTNRGVESATAILVRCSNK